MKTQLFAGTLWLATALLCFTLFTALWNIRTDCQARNGEIHGSFTRGYVCL